MRPAQPASGHGAGRWLLAALLLHAGAAQLVAKLSRGPIRPAPPSSSSARPSRDLELIFIDDEAPSVAAEQWGESSASIATERRLPEQGPSSPEAHRPAAPDVPSDASHEGSTEVAANQSETSSPTPSLPGVGSEGPAQTGAHEPADIAAPTLSLDQLGIGASNPFRSFAKPPPPAKEDANQRLQASLREGSRERDGRRGLGPEGPVLRAAHQLVVADELLVETSAVIDVRVDAAGRIASLHLSSASSQSEDWRRLADKLLTTLGPIQLRLLGANEGLGFKLRLASTMQLPSGAAPGVRLDLLGRTLHEGAGPGSTSLSLSPTAPLQAEQVFDTAGRHQDRPIQFELGLFELKGDVADAAARPRRVVQVTVLAWSGKEQ